MPKGDTYVCRSCKQTFPLCKNAKGFYCSTQCQKNYEWEKKKENILAEGKYPSGKAARRFLLERDGHACQFPGCGCREWDGKPVPLIVDHIDGNSDNWAMENIRLICPNCDGLTDTYKNRNRGRGRHVRKTGVILPTHPSGKTSSNHKKHKSQSEGPPIPDDSIRKLEQQLEALKLELDQHLKQAAGGGKG